jgi:hypothetical protein
MSTKLELEQEHYMRVGLLTAIGGSTLVWLAIIVVLLV